MNEVSLLREEIRIIHQSLNEVCNGFLIDDFEGVVGATKAAVKSEMETLRKIYEETRMIGTAIQGNFSSEHLRIYASALKATIKELDHPSEFHSRIGVPKGKALEIVKDLENALM